jgi:hypothetical protein
MQLTQKQEVLINKLMYARDRELNEYVPELLLSVLGIKSEYVDSYYETMAEEIIEDAYMEVIVAKYELYSERIKRGWGSLDLLSDMPYPVSRQEFLDWISKKDWVDVEDFKPSYLERLGIN